MTKSEWRGTKGGCGKWGRRNKKVEARMTLEDEIAGEGRGRREGL